MSALSEDSKRSLRTFAKLIRENDQMNRATSLGPVKLIKIITRRMDEIDRDTIDHLDEAAKYLGALLGMM